MMKPVEGNAAELIMFLAELIGEQSSRIDKIIEVVSEYEADPSNIKNEDGQSIDPEHVKYYIEGMKRIAKLLEFVKLPVNFHKCSEEEAEEFMRQHMKPESKLYS